MIFRNKTKMKNYFLLGLSIILMGGCNNTSNDFKSKTTNYLLNEKARLYEKVKMNRDFVLRTRTDRVNRPHLLDFSQKTEVLLERMEREIKGGIYANSDLKKVYEEANKLYPYISNSLISVTRFEDPDLDDLQRHVAYLRLFNEVLSSYYQRTLGCASFSKADLFSFNSGKEVSLFYGVYDTSNLKDKLVIHSVHLEGKEIEATYSSHLYKGSVNVIFDVEESGTYKWRGEYFLKLHMNFYDTLQVSGEFTVQE